MAEVGVRELRQNLSQYLRRVAGGETLTVSERGRPVAVLGPLPASAGALEQLIALGRVRRATHDLAELGSPPARSPRMSITEALALERAES